jgi:hypothetical protein
LFFLTVSLFSWKEIKIAALRLVSAERVVDDDTDISDEHSQNYRRRDTNNK